MDELIFEECYIKCETIITAIHNSDYEEEPEDFFDEVVEAYNYISEKTENLEGQIALDIKDALDCISYALEECDDGIGNYEIIDSEINIIADNFDKLKNLLYNFEEDNEEY
jgi:hypothetical protein